MSLILKQVTNKSSLRQFIYLPAEIHAGRKNWLPPIYQDEWKFHDPKHNPSLEYSDVVRFLAFKNGKAVGRIMGIINKKYNELHREKSARFFNLETIDDAKIVSALLDEVEKWARQKGMT